MAELSNNTIYFIILLGVIITTVKVCRYQEVTRLIKMQRENNRHSVALTSALKRVEEVEGIIIKYGLPVNFDSVKRQIKIVRRHLYRKL